MITSRTFWKRLQSTLCCSAQSSYTLLSPTPHNTAAKPVAYFSTKLIYIHVCVSMYINSVLYLQPWVQFFVRSNDFLSTYRPLAISNRLSHSACHLSFGSNHRKPEILNCGSTILANLGSCILSVFLRFKMCGEQRDMFFYPHHRSAGQSSFLGCLLLCGSSSYLFSPCSLYVQSLHCKLYNWFVILLWFWILLYLINYLQHF